MKRYLNLYFHFFKNSLAREMEFRLNFVVWIFLSLIWYGMAFGFVYLLFGQVETLAGWSKNEVLLLTVMFSLFEGTFWVIFIRNFVNLSDMIRHGTLDFVLLKPVSSCFFVSCRFFEFRQAPQIFFYPILIVKFMADLNMSITLPNLIIFLITFIAGMVIIYSLFFIITTTNFWFVNLFNLEFFFESISESGRIPTFVFKGLARLFFFYLVPVVFIATYPTMALLGRLGIADVFISLIMAGTFFFISQWFWRYALNRYQSASS